MSSRHKNLIVVRAGDKSLHPQWLDKNLRNWDLAVSYFGDYPERYKDQYDHLHVCKGSKWQGLSDFVHTQSDLIAKYEYIWFPDDDLLTTCEVINEFFVICKQLDYSITQPALTRYSHFSWDITLENPATDFRQTDFIEIMAPCFKQKTFDLFKGTFEINTSGWGLEWLWRHIALKNDVFKFAIIDKTPIYHTRKVGTAAHGGAIGSPKKEFDALMREYQLTVTQPQVLQSGHLIDLSSSQTSKDV
jgi:hypothetical protein